MTTYARATSSMARIHARLRCGSGPGLAGITRVPLERVARLVGGGSAGRGPTPPQHAGEPGREAEHDDEQRALAAHDPQEPNTARKRDRNASGSAGLSSKLNPAVVGM